MVIPVQAELTAENKTASLAHIRHFVSNCLAKSQVSQEQARLIVLAVDEAVSSIVYNADEPPCESHIKIRIDINPQRFMVLIHDSSHNFHLAPLPLTTLHEIVEKHRHLEIGIFLIREIMDEVNYIYKRGNANQLEMIKYLT